VKCPSCAAPRTPHRCEYCGAKGDIEAPKVAWAPPMTHGTTGAFDDDTFERWYRQAPAWERDR